MKELTLCAAFILILITAGPVFAEEMTVLVSVAPQKYFVDQIAEERVKVEVMVPPGADPHTYEPKPSQMVKVSKAAVYFAVGITFEEAWLPRFSSINKKMLIVHTDERVKKRPMKAHHHEEEHDEHTKEGARQAEEFHLHHEGLDPHIWTSPPLVMIQARAILNGLLEVDPLNKDFYEKNYARFIDALAALDKEIRMIIGTGKEVGRLLVFHPSWGYFADAYGLEEISIEVEGKEPKPAALKELIEESRKMGVKAVFVQPQFSRKIAETIAQAIGAKVVFADPLAVDWAENLKRVAGEFSRALR
jgi:zinc transport system substrate-binding protein